MPDVPEQDQATQAQGERALYSQVLRDFKGCYTKSDRTQMPKDHFYDLENIIPLGPSNYHVVPNIGPSLFNFTTHTIYYAVYVIVASVPYQICFAADGTVWAYNWNSATAAQINSGHLLSGSASRCTQWQNTYVLFIDSTGYYSWNGTTFSVLAGANQPTTGSDICAYAGRVWVSSGRLISFTSAYTGLSADDPTGNTAWTVAEGAGFVNMTDPTLVGSITRLFQQNGYLYIFGATCVYAISDLYIPAGASPPTPVFTITMIQGIIGTDQPLSVFAFNRLMCFANRFGAWAIAGVDAERMSDDIDGTWQYLAFATPISGGQCVVLSQLNAAFLITRASDPVFGSGPVIALWFDSKWWFGNVSATGTATLISSALVNNVPVVLAFIGNQMYQVFGDPTTSPAITAKTPLWSMDDPLSSKVMIRGGIELTTATIAGTISLTADGVNGSASIPISATAGSLSFTGAGGAPLIFSGTGPITWSVSTAYLQYSASAPGTFSPYIGMTLTASGSTFQLASFLIDWKKGQRWSP